MPGPAFTKPPLPEIPPDIVKAYAAGEVGSAEVVTVTPLMSAIGALIVWLPADTSMLGTPVEPVAVLSIVNVPPAP